MSVKLRITDNILPVQLLPVVLEIPALAAGLIVMDLIKETVSAQYQLFAINCRLKVPEVK